MDKNVIIPCFSRFFIKFVEDILNVRDGSENDSAIYGAVLKHLSAPVIMDYDYGLWAYGGGNLLNASSIKVLSHLPQALYRLADDFPNQYMGMLHKAYQTDNAIWVKRLVATRAMSITMSLVGYATAHSRSLRNYFEEFHNFFAARNIANTCIKISATQYTNTYNIACLYRGDIKNTYCGSDSQFINAIMPFLRCLCTPPTCYLWVALYSQDKRHLFENFSETCLEEAVSAQLNLMDSQQQTSRLFHYGEFCIVVTRLYHAASKTTLYAAAAYRSHQAYKEQEMAFVPR